MVKRPQDPLQLRTLLKAWGRILAGYKPLLSIEITRECPLRCPGCYAYGEDHLGGGVTLRQLSDRRGKELVEGVCQLVDKHRPLQVSFVGGEPLIRHRELSRILPRMSRQGIFSLVVTSGVIPFPRDWNKIPRLRITVSIDGLQPEHDARRYPATYERIIGNLEGRRADISLVVTDVMLKRSGYLDDYLAVWTARPEIERIWLSVYTPQRGEQSPEMLSHGSRQELIRQLPALKQKYPDLILADGAIKAFADPPQDPAHCTFTRLSANYSADLKTRVQPCFFGGDPDCSQCGCAVSAGLHRLHGQKIPYGLGLRVGHVIDTTLAVGLWSSSLRNGRGERPRPLVSLKGE